MADTSELLHPVRLRIVQQLLSDGALTTGQLHEILADVPVATLYRHVKRLQVAELIEVAEQLPIRGATERTYRLAPTFANPSGDDLSGLSREELKGVFTVLATGLVRDFELYLESGEPDLVADRVTFAQADFWASGEEIDELTDVLTAALRKLMENTETSQRRRRKLTTVLVPRKEIGA